MNAIKIDIPVLHLLVHTLVVLASVRARQQVAVRLDTLDTVCCVKILGDGNLEETRAALASNDDRACEEKVPEAV